jgi:hypothetical protein
MTDWSRICKLFPNPEVEKIHPGVPSSLPDLSCLAFVLITHISDIPNPMESAV